MFVCLFFSTMDLENIYRHGCARVHYVGVSTCLSASTFILPLDLQVYIEANQPVLASAFSVSIVPFFVFLLSKSAMKGLTFDERNPARFFVGGVSVFVDKGGTPRGRRSAEGPRSIQASVAGGETGGFFETRPAKWAPDPVISMALGPPINGRK